MAIIYRGRDEVLKERFDEVQPTLAARYREILGPKDYQRLEKIASRVLPPESFIHSAEDAQAHFGDVIPYSPKNARMAYISGDIDLNNPTNSGKRNPCSAVIFANQDSIKNSTYTATTDNPLAPFIHEFNHFVWFALQKVPYYALGQSINDELGLPPVSSKVNVGKQITAIGKSDAPIEKKRYQVALTMYSDLLTKMYEDTNRILDRLVMESIGIEVDYSWRHKPKQYQMMGIEAANILVHIPTSGDHAGQFTDVETVKRTVNWEDFFAVQTNNPKVASLITKVKKLKMRKISVHEMMAED